MISPTQVLRPPWRAARALPLVVVGSFVMVGASASPAAAHGTGGLQATNYQTRILQVTPRVPGITLHVVDVGTRLELVNTTRHDVIVLGYNGEPYLRVGPRGVFENRRSPAVYLNQTFRGATHVPGYADPTATPEWHRISDGRVARWHDHRAHWMGTTDPPAVRRAPGEEHLVQRFQLTLERQGSTIRVSGDVRWIPGPAPWGSVFTAAALAVVLILAGRRSPELALATGLLVAVLAQLTHAVGEWGAWTASAWSRLGASAYSLGAMMFAVGALAVLSRRGLHAAAPLALFAGTFLAVGGGLADITDVTRSQVPTTNAAWVDRLAIALTLGGALGAVAISGRHLVRRRPSPPPAANRSSPDESSASSSASSLRAAFTQRQRLGRARS